MDSAVTPEAVSVGAELVRPLELRWLVRIRWAAIFAQCFSLLGTRYVLHAPFPALSLLLVVFGLALVNAVLALQLRAEKTLSEPVITLHLLLDVVVLTVLLLWTGGAMNPFTTLYLLHVALAGVLVGRRWSLLLTSAAVVAFGALLLTRPEAIHVWHSASMFELHVRGMWLAFALTAGCLWYFVERVSSAFRARDLELANARIEASKAERVAAVATLAAGAAHELNTPLGTIAVLAAELSEQLRATPEASESVQLIRSEVKRCKELLAGLRAQEGLVESRVSVAVEPWLREALTLWQARNPTVDVRFAQVSPLGSRRIEIAELAVRRVVHCLLDNARYAQRDAKNTQPLEVQAREERDGLVVCVRDHGVGLTKEQLEHAGEPFFTTREPGQGLGLGLFLARSTLEQHGGSLVLRSEKGCTEAEFRLPFAAVTAVPSAAE